MMLVFHLLFKNAATYNQSNASEKPHFYNLIQQNNQIKKDPFHFPEQNSQFKQHKHTRTYVCVCVCVLIISLTILYFYTPYMR